MKKFYELDQNDQVSIELLLQHWLINYTDDCVKRVLSRIEEIVNNEVVLQMLRTMYLDEKESKKWFNRSLHLALLDSKVEDFHKPWSDSQHYRQVLYDLFIKEKKEEK